MVNENFIHATAGGAGGIIAMTATYPLVSISMRAAVQSSKNPEEVSERNGQSRAQRTETQEKLSSWSGSVREATESLLLETRRLAAAGRARAA